MIYVKSEKEIELMREPCKIVRDTLAFVGSKIQAGMSTKEIDELAKTMRPFSSTAKTTSLAPSLAV